LPIEKKDDLAPALAAVKSAYDYVKGGAGTSTRKKKARK
jgi:hypothetical protein